MKAISDKTMESHEEVALEGLKAMKAFLAYQGANEDYLKRAKVGVAAVAAYAKLRQSESGRITAVLVATRMASEPIAAKILDQEGLLPGGGHSRSETFEKRQVTRDGDDRTAVHWVRRYALRRVSRRAGVWT